MNTAIKKIYTTPSTFVLLQGVELMKDWDISAAPNPGNAPERRVIPNA
jgi:hypothetical protein